MLKVHHMPQGGDHEDSYNQQGYRSAVRECFAQVDYDFGGKIEDLLDKTGLTSEGYQELLYLKDKFLDNPEWKKLFNELDINKYASVDEFIGEFRSYEKICLLDDVYKNYALDVLRREQGKKLADAYEYILQRKVVESYSDYYHDKLMADRFWGQLEVKKQSCEDIIEGMKIRKKIEAITGRETPIWRFASSQFGFLPKELGLKGKITKLEYAKILLHMVEQMTFYAKNKGTGNPRQEGDSW